MDKKVKRLEEDLKKCIEEKEEYLNGWKRAKADYANYKREEIERMSKIIEYKEEEMVLEILPVIDSFADAEKSMTEEDQANETIKGFIRIKNNLDNLIKKIGIEKIESLGQLFDPNFHEAVELVEAEGESGIVAEEILKGYMRNGRVIRPTKVKVIK